MSSDAPTPYRERPAEPAPIAVASRRWFVKWGYGAILCAVLGSATFAPMAYVRACSEFGWGECAHPMFALALLLQPPFVAWLARWCARAGFATVTIYPDRLVHRILWRTTVVPLDRATNFARHVGWLGTGLAVERGRARFILVDWSERDGAPVERALESVVEQHVDALRDGASLSVTITPDAADTLRTAGAFVGGLGALFLWALAADARSGRPLTVGRALFTVTMLAAGAWLFSRGARRAKDRESVSVLEADGFRVADGRWTPWGEVRALTHENGATVVTRRRGDVVALTHPRSPESQVAAHVAERLFADAVSCSRDGDA